MTDPVVLAALEDLALAFPRHDMPPKTLALYARRLANLPPAAVAAAIYRAIDTATFPPSIGELKAALSDVSQGDAVLPETAWAEVEGEVRRVGYNRLPGFANGQFHPAPKPEFSDPRIAEAVAAMGWKYLCTGEPISTVKAQFERTLRAICERATTRIQTGRLPDGTPIDAGDALPEGRSGLSVLPGGREKAS